MPLEVYPDWASVDERMGAKGYEPDPVLYELANEQARMEYEFASGGIPKLGVRKDEDTGLKRQVPLFPGWFLARVDRIILDHWDRMERERFELIEAEKEERRIRREKKQAR